VERAATILIKEGELIRIRGVLRFEEEMSAGKATILRTYSYLLRLDPARMDLQKAPSFRRR